MPIFNLAQLAKNTEEVSFEPIPEGTYYLVPKKGSIKMETQNEKTFLKAEFIVVLNDDEKLNGKTVNNRFYFTEKAAPFSFLNLKNGFGITLDQVESWGDDWEANLVKAMDRPFVAETVIEEREGQDKEGNDTTFKNAVIKKWMLAPEDVVTKYKEGKISTGKSGGKKSPSSASAESKPAAPKTNVSDIPDLPDFE